jgi:hypothetical protein
VGTICHMLTCNTDKHMPIRTVACLGSSPHWRRLHAQPNPRHLLGDLPSALQSYSPPKTAQPCCRGLNMAGRTAKVPQHSGGSH